MRCAKFMGKKGLVEIGGRRLEPGDIVGEPGTGGGTVVGCTGVVEYLLKRRDFEAVYTAPQDPMDNRDAEIEAVAAELDDELTEED